MKQYAKLMRVRHYIKNLLVFVALAFSGQLTDGGKFLAGLEAFISFSLMASVVYIFNDLKDAEKDKNHPVKCKRPIASGAVSRSSAIVLAAVLFICSMLVNLLVFSVPSTLLLLSYLALNIAYSCGLKKVPLLDISILVSGFVIRIIYGAMVTDIVISNWLYLTVFAATFFFSLGKRRNELEQLAGAQTRDVLQNYTVDFLDKNMYMCLALTNVFYAVWSMDAKTIATHGNNLVLTMPLVLIITMKYSMDIESGMDGDPVEVLLHDRVLMALCLLYAVILLVILYL